MYCMYIADTFDFSRFMEARSTMNRRRGGGGEYVKDFSRRLWWKTIKYILYLSYCMSYIDMYKSGRQTPSYSSDKFCYIHTYIYVMEEEKTEHPSAGQKKIFPVYFRFLVTWTVCIRVRIYLINRRRKRQKIHPDSQVIQKLSCSQSANFT